MAQRNSGYEKLPAYATPAWVTRALFPHLPKLGVIWEPAAGDGSMARVLAELGGHVFTGDITEGDDFLGSRSVPSPFLSGRYRPRAAIITNPPYDLVTRFIEVALARTSPVDGMVAMLLRTDVDHAASPTRGRRHLFGDCRAFAKKLVLTRRIVWFVDPETGKPKKGPSENHAWFIWDWRHLGPPTIAYGPEPTEEGKHEHRRERAEGRRTAEALARK